MNTIIINKNRDIDMIYIGLIQSILQKNKIKP